MSRYELQTHDEDLSIHVGWDENQAMFYMETQELGLPIDYALESELDNLAIQAERYGEMPEAIKENLLREESKYFAQDHDFAMPAEKDLTWEEDLQIIIDEHDFSRGDEWEL